MKILYGVQGTGNGHIARARMMASHFARRKVDVQFLFSGRPADKYFDMECFGDYQLRKGLTFATVNGAVNSFKTLLEAQPLQFVRDVRGLDLDSYDLIVTDFEPVTAWAGRLRGKTVIGVGHQYAFGYRNVPQAGVNLRNRLIMKMFAPVTHRLGLHWNHFNAPIVPPIINPAEKRAGVVGDHVVVYLPFENQQRITESLKSFPDTRFIQYSPELVDSQDGNISLRKTSLHGFKRDLCSARAVMCNAGFELISECLHMGVPVLAKPVAGQSEQLGNAAALQALGHARIMYEYDPAIIADWLSHPEAPRPQRYPDVAAAICDWLLSGNWHDTSELVESTWQLALPAGHRVFST